MQPMPADTKDRPKSTGMAIVIAMPVSFYKRIDTEDS